MRKLLITSLIVALPLAVSCSDDAQREEATATEFGVQQDAAEIEQDAEGQVQQEEEAEVIQTDEANIVDRDATTSQLQPADASAIQEREVERGSTDVQYKAQRVVTETLLKQEQIPTIQICRTKADINRMDKQDFTALGFDAQTADKIVQQRSQRGQFSSVDELSQIQGVSQNQFQQVKDSLGVGEKRQAQEAQ